MLAPAYRVGIALVAGVPAPSSFTDVTSDVLRFDVSRKVAALFSPLTVGDATVELANDDGRYSPLNAAGPYYPNLRSQRQLTIAASFLGNALSLAAIAGQQARAQVDGNARAEYLLLPGTANNYATTPDAPANRVTGDIDVRVRLAAALPAAQRYILNKGRTTSTRAWTFGFGTSGVLVSYFSSDGTTCLNAGASEAHASTAAATGWDAIAPIWVRMTRASGTGTITYYTSPDGVLWTQLGATVASTAGPAFDPTHPPDHRHARPPAAAPHLHAHRASRLLRPLPP